MIRMTTLFSLCENVHLTKDVGMIPYLMHKNHDYDCTIASYQNGEYPSLVSNTNGLKLVFIKRVFRNATLDSLWYLIKNFNKIDLIQLYHLTYSSVVIFTVFKVLKIFSKHRIVYLKMDAGEEIKKTTYTGLKGRIIKFLISKIDLITVETTDLCRFLNQKNLLGQKVDYLPNGFYPASDPVNYTEKKNLILTVGRIGTLQKSNDILLKAFKYFARKNKNWNLEIVGPIEPSFKKNINDFFAEDHDLTERVSFTGAINDKALLKKKYDDAKIFVLTSKWEGFPLVFLEAMRSGCTIISTDLIAVDDVTDGGKYGEKFKIDDYQALADILLRKVNDEEYLRTNTFAIQQYANSKFYWPDIVEQLNKLIESKLVNAR